MEDAWYLLLPFVCVIIIPWENGDKTFCGVLTSCCSSICFWARSDARVACFMPSVQARGRAPRNTRNAITQHDNGCEGIFPE
uniref:Uncharacterized protein n=1 Tax=Arundo donax TaxID=35708 RepID=A0A0A9D174_ARUDO